MVTFSLSVLASLKKRLIFSWLIFLCHGIEFGVSTLDNCPESCSCTEKASTLKILVNCTSRNLSDIPSNFPERTEDLLLAHNKIEIADMSSLPVLPDLKTMDISNNNVRSVIGSPKLNEVMQNLETLDLSHNKLTEIPSDLPRSTKSLHLRFNYIRYINGNAFQTLKKLRALFLDHNLIKLVNTSSFHSDNEEEIILANLESLSLKKNKIGSVSPKAFENLISLTALNLGKNKLVSLQSKVFYRLLDLEHLDLSYNKLNFIEDETFFMLKSLRFLSLKHNILHTLPLGLPMLEWLDLSHNRLRNISSHHQSDLYPAELLILAHNPLHCDCEMVWVKELFDRREYLLKHIELSHADFVPQCASPKRMGGDTWDVLSDDVFICKPEDADEEVIEGLVPDNTGQHLSSVRLGQVSDHSIQLHWSLRNNPPFSSVFIQYYVFGMRSSTLKHVEVNAAQREFTLKHLSADSNYIACIIPKMTSDTEPEKLKPLSYDHCLEVVTGPPKRIQNLSYVAVAGYYFLGMMATIIGIFSFIGGIALLYGMWNAKCSDWSAKYAAEAPMPDLDIHTKLSQEEAARNTSSESQTKNTERGSTSNKEEVSTHPKTMPSETSASSNGETPSENKKDR